MTIMAHSDDDLLFVNPDLQPAIASGLPVRGVVLTSDEYNGTDDLSPEELAAQLREGTRLAYASLAGDVANDWDIDTIEVADRILEVNTLVAAPQIQLYWLNLPDGGDERYPDALLTLWGNPTDTTETILVTDSPVTEKQEYSAEQLYLVLVGLLDLFQPTIIRVQDPVPDRRLDAELPAGEHSDHVATASFAQLAVRTYEGPTATGLALLTRYRCYNTQVSPENVPGTLLDPKTTAYHKYNDLDPLSGDYFDVALARNYHRFPVSAPWAVRDGTGTLHAFVVGADDVIAWRQPAGATTWTGPTSLVSGAFAPGIAVAVDADGRVRLAVLNMDDAEVMTARQSSNGGGGFGTWTSIGRPAGSDPLYGVPALGVNADGGLEMYVLDETGGLSNAYQVSPTDDFDGWYGVDGGPNIVGQPVVHTMASGLLHVFADNNGTTAHWTQPPGSGTAPAASPTVECVATPSAVTQGNGSARILTREYGDGAVGTSVETTTWSGLTHIAGSPGGVGPVAAVLSGGTSPRVLVFARNNGYGISVSRQAASGSFGAWEDLGGYCEVGPAAVVDNAGLVRLVAVGADCKLYERKQTAAGPDGTFAAWQVAGT